MRWWVVQAKWRNFNCLQMRSVDKNNNKTKSQEQVIPNQTTRPFQLGEGFGRPIHFLLIQLF